MRCFLTAALFAMAVTSANAQTEISVQYAYPDLFDTTMKETLAAFEGRHPDIKVTFRTPYKDYEDASQRILREAIVGSAPDITFQGLNRLRILADRDIAMPLNDLIATETDFSAEGFHPAMLAAGTVGKTVYGLPYAISLPIVYYNLDLVRRAGGDPENLPRTWNEVIELAGKINDLEGNAKGIVAEWAITGNWLWQALVFAHGGTMLTADESNVAFDEEAGRRAIGILARLANDVSSPNLSPNDMIAAFSAGEVGMFVTTTARLNALARQIGDRFELKTDTFPDLAPETSRLPAGGNVAAITATDPQKQQAAWTFLKFVTGVEGGPIMVRTTGYMAPNEKATKNLDDFYDANPNQYTAVEQLPYLTGWYAFPGENGLKITDVIKDHLQTVMDGSRTQEPEAVLSEMADDVRSLLPRN